MTPHPGTPPLRGVRVLDASSYAAGPVVGQILAGLGACVLKVERPPHGDPERNLWAEMFDAHNRGKHSVLLDLRDGGDTALFRELASSADVVIENFRPDVGARLGLDFATLSAVQDQVILVSVSGYGSRGPYADAPGYEHQFRALAGDFALSSSPDGAPVETWSHDYAVFGYASAFYAAIGILAARAAEPRRATHLEVPLLAAGYAWMFGAIRNPAYRTENAHRVQHTFRAGDGRRLAISAPLPAHFTALMEEIGRPDVVTAAGGDPFAWQYRHHDAYVTAIEQGLAAADADTWVERLRARGIPVAPVLTPEEMREDPQLRALDLGVEDPANRLRLPIDGLATVWLGPSPAPDADGAAVRARGWAGILP